MTPIQQAVEIVGGQSELARRIGGSVRQPHVWKWLRRGFPPGEYCRSIEAATDGRVSRYILRPDIYGEPPQDSAAA
jgi:DNA-binding transcriptional regulator YdaS (Cro superfamily)